MAEAQPAALYHYTTRDFAEESLRDFADPGVYAEIWEGLYGPGFYALDLGPTELSREELRWECFGDARPNHPMDGVFELDPALAVPPFEPCSQHIWIVPGDAGNPQAIDHMITAIGVWDGQSWVWSET
jgi:hypothetical protein